MQTDYLRFYQGFAREDFEKIFRCGQAAWMKAKETSDVPWQITTAAFLACGFAMTTGDAPEIQDLFSDIERLQKTNPWPSGKCCELIARSVAAFGRGDPLEIEKYQMELEVAANKCQPPKSFNGLERSGFEGAQIRPWPNSSAARIRR